MNKRRMARILSAYADGECSARERAEAERLIAEQPEAREYLRACERMREGIRDAASAEVSGAFAADVVRAVRLGEDDVRQWIPAERFAERLVTSLAAIVLVVVMLTSIMRPDEPLERVAQGGGADSTAYRYALDSEEFAQYDALTAAAHK